MLIQILQLAIWPAAFSVVILVALFCHPGLKNAKFRKFGKDGVEIEVQAIAAQQIESAPERHPVPAQLQRLIDNSQKWGTSRKLSEDTRKLFADATMPIEGPGGLALLKLTGMLILQQEFEEIYNFIFGSQIWLLRRINGSRPGWHGSQIDKHVQTVKERFAGRMDSMDTATYMNFLMARELMVLDGDTFSVSEKGMDFLAWMTEKGRSDDKSL